MTTNHTPADQATAPACFVLWLDASDGSIPTHDGVRWPDGTATLHHRHFGHTTTHPDPETACHMAHGKQGRVVWPEPPADRAALRDRIAEALREHGMAHLGDEAPADEYDCCADAVLAVLPPPVSRADVLREAANSLACLGPEDSLVSGPVAWTEAVETLRRMPDEAQPDDTVHTCPGRWGGPNCRCFNTDEAQPGTEARGPVAADQCPKCRRANSEAWELCSACAAEAQQDGAQR